MTYPILSANTTGFRGTAVFHVRGVRIGVFALAGPDFAQLVKTPGLTFTDPIAAAREAVRVLRDEQHADAVVMVGHEDVDDDERLARAVPGIDVIFGSHSHLKRELTQIAGTTTSYISPSQYLTYISRIELTIADGRVKSVRGGLVPVDDSMRPDPKIASRVRTMQRHLERDPRYRELFTPIGKRAAPLSTDALSRLTVETMREAGKADVALSTKSSFRAPLPAGTLTMELLRGALPYDNQIVTCTMTGVQLRKLFDAAAEDSVVAAPATIEDAKNYVVATTDYLAHVAFRDVFTCDKTSTGLSVRGELKKKLVQ